MIISLTFSDAFSSPWDVLATYGYEVKLLVTYFLQSSNQHVEVSPTMPNCSRLLLFGSPGLGLCSVSRSFRTTRWYSAL